MTNTPTSIEHRRQQLIAQITQIDYALPGSLTVRHTRCSNKRCHCHNEPPALHGPNYSWTRKNNGKTITRRLPPEEAKRYRTWFENARKLRAFIKELETLSLKKAEQTERWKKQKPKTKKTTHPHPQPNKTNKQNTQLQTTE